MLPFWSLVLCAPIRVCGVMPPSTPWSCQRGQNCQITGEKIMSNAKSQLCCLVIHNVESDLFIQKASLV